MGDQMRRVTDALEQAIDDTRRTTSAARNFLDTSLICRHFENARRADQDLFKRLLVIVFQAVDGSEAITQWRCHCTGSRSNAYESERRQNDTCRPGPRPFYDHYITLQVIPRLI